MAMRVWATCVIALFSLTELYQWVQASKLSLPIYSLAGLALALISNSKWWSQSQRLFPASAQPASFHTASHTASEAFSEALPDAMPDFKIDSDTISQSPRPSVELPPLSPPPQQEPISFTIHKPEQV
jgi:hypothetical protein